MKNIFIYIRGIFLRVLFWSAWLFFSITRMPVRGALVAIWYKEDILLIQKSYRSAWSIPGGLVDRGETAPQAAVRETFEEVGLRIHLNELMFVAEVPGDLGPNDRAQLFEVVVNHPLDLIPDQLEIIRAEFVSPDIALQRELTPAVAAYLQSRHAV